MAIFKNIGLLVLLACVAQHVSEAGTDNDHERKSKRDGTIRNSRASNVFKGKFSTKDKTQCTWKAEGTDTYIMTVRCTKGKDVKECTYMGRPDTCPGYADNTKGYWKQIGRSVKKQKKLCQDPRGLIRAGMCKRAPQDAHFKLVDTPTDAGQPKVVPTVKAVKKLVPTTTTKTSTTVTTPKGGKPPCTERVDHKKLAEEKCGETWASLCNFLFTFVQSSDC
ncbi:fibroblast growth factor-binding protein 1 [Engraulis encrasicolus]|uniref:fibroblast growth factor-binding protein 1 n=1 Tax=Engraulis encrasicolus TaxID=184585 RepID=UPI002FD5E216